MYGRVKANKDEQVEKYQDQFKDENDTNSTRSTGDHHEGFKAIVIEVDTP